MLRFARIQPEEHSEWFREILRLRYKVYCLERGFEKVSDHPDGLESDVYDNRSIHFAAFYESGTEVVGTVRLIKNSSLGFPVEKHFGLDLNPMVGCRDQVCEISRLSVSRKYRSDFNIVKGLFESVALESRRLGVTHWCAAMAQGLPRLLSKQNIHLKKIGPEIEFHGPRAPYFGRIDDVASRHNAYALYRGDQQTGKVASSL
ncbi:MAG: GNAT family N-acyltransferase [Thermodesulfobacteriota bacterium]|nr:GNAT family N-acyltransferase [Thermodesulfobacteriota bacterium]